MEVNNTIVLNVSKQRIFELEEELLNHRLICVQQSNDIEMYKKEIQEIRKELEEVRTLKLNETTKNTYRKENDK